MFYPFKQLMILALLVLAGCAAQPVVKVPSAEQEATAQRFLNQVGVGELAIRGYRDELQRMAREQPGMAELVERVFADFKPRRFEQMAATVYARHLSLEHLSELEQYSRRPAIKRFFAVIFEAIASGEPVDNQALMRQFNADELTEIMRFSSSESVTALKQVQAQINQELSEASRQYAEAAFARYMKQQK